MLDTMDKECSAIREDCLRISWNMRGGVTYNTALEMSAAERRIVGQLVKENHDIVKKTGLPYF